MSELTCMTPTVVQIVDKHNTFSAGIDDSTATLQTIEYPHHEIHEGNAFIAFAQATINSDATITIVIKTPNTAKWFHIVPFSRATGEANLCVYEGSTVDAETGSQLDIFNRNRNSSTESGSIDTSTATPTPNKATLDPTIGALGTCIYAEHFGSGQVTGGASVNRNEFDLAPNTVYSFQITSEAASNDCDLILNWYEHTDKA